MSYLNDEALDGGLDWIVSTGTVLHICSAEPANYAGIAAVELGSKTGLTMTGPADGDTDGRKVTCPAVTDGTVGATGTASHWAISNGLDTLVAAGALASTQAVTAGNTFSTGAFAVATLRDPS